MVMIYSSDRQIEPCEKKIISLGEWKISSSSLVAVVEVVVVAVAVVALSHFVDKSGINSRTERAPIARRENQTH